MAKTTKKNENIKRKVEAIRNSNINLNTIIDNEDELQITIDFNVLIAPAERPRTRGFGKGLYDPLCDYKDIINKRIKELYPHEVMTGEVKMEILLYKKVPDSYPDWMKYYGYAGLIDPIDKPDLDNVEKTIMDSLKNVIWSDDCQVTRLSSEKYYHTEDLSFIRLTYKRKKIESPGRLKKADKLKLEEMIKNRKIGF